jgi:hypothetical protein
VFQLYCRRVPLVSIFETCYFLEYIRIQQAIAVAMNSNPVFWPFEGPVNIVSGFIAILTGPIAFPSWARDVLFLFEQEKTAESDILNPVFSSPHVEATVYAVMQRSVSNVRVQIAARGYDFETGTPESLLLMVSGMPELISRDSAIAQKAYRFLAITPEDNDVSQGFGIGGFLEELSGIARLGTQGDTAYFFDMLMVWSLISRLRQSHPRSGNYFTAMGVLGLLRWRPLVVTMLHNHNCGRELHMVSAPIPSRTFSTRDRI